MTEHWLERRLGEHQEKIALVWRGRELSYRDLLCGTSTWRKTLFENGIEPGDCVALECEYSPSSCMLLCALIADHCIAVPLSLASATRNVRLMDIAAAKYVCRFDQHDNWHLSRREPKPESQLLEEIRRSREAGLVLFTSGSTGESKGVLLSFDKLLAKFEKKRKALCTLTFLLLDHIGGLNTLFHVLCNGGTVVTISDRHPRAICAAIQEHKVQLLPTTPTFLNILLMSEAYKEYDLSSLEMVTYGTEPMPQSTIEKLSEIFPNIEFKQTYGLSEIGILQTKSRDSRSLWVKVGGSGYETKIQGGTLWIRAKSAMIGYLNAASPIDSEGWFDTGDAVEVDGEYVRILGRKSEIINVGGEKVFPAEVESVILEMPNIRDVVVSGKRNPITGSVVIATVSLFEAEDSGHLTSRVREFCRGRLAEYQIPVIVVATEKQQYSDRFKKGRVSQ